jgi:3-phenylpropionate/cinnamic acid dioxygenase small subunit
MTVQPKTVNSAQPVNGNRRRAWTMTTFLPVSAQIYSEVHQFMMHEAHLLDHNCLEAWAALLVPDISYCIHDLQRQSSHLPVSRKIEGSRSLLEILHSCAQTPDSSSDPGAYLIRRCVMNVNVSFAHCRDEFGVASYLQVHGVERSGRTGFTCTAERRDHLRRTSRSFKIVSREIFLESIEPASFVLPVLI